MKLIYVLNGIDPYHLEVASLKYCKVMDDKSIKVYYTLPRKYVLVRKTEIASAFYNYEDMINSGRYYCSSASHVTDGFISCEGNYYLDDITSIKSIDDYSKCLKRNGNLSYFKVGKLLRNLSNKR